MSAGAALLLNLAEFCSNHGVEYQKAVYKILPSLSTSKNWTPEFDHRLAGLGFFSQQFGNGLRRDFVLKRLMKTNNITTAPLVGCQDKDTGPELTQIQQILRVLEALITEFQRNKRFDLLINTEVPALPENSPFFSDLKEVHNCMKDLYFELEQSEAMEFDILPRLEAATQRLRARLPGA